MKAFPRLVCTLLVTGCVSVYAQQDVALQTSPILTKEVFQRQFTVDSVTGSYPYNNASVGGPGDRVVAPTPPWNPFFDFKADQYEGPPTAAGFLKQTLTAALGSFDYLGGGTANYKISGDIEILDSIIGRDFLVPVDVKTTARIAYTISGGGISRQFSMSSTATVPKRFFK